MPVESALFSHISWKLHSVAFACDWTSLAAREVGQHLIKAGVFLFCFSVFLVLFVCFFRKRGAWTLQDNEQP